jgi:hypothetical protein
MSKNAIRNRRKRASRKAAKDKDASSPPSLPSLSPPQPEGLNTLRKWYKKLNRKENN